MGCGRMTPHSPTGTGEIYSYSDLKTWAVRPLRRMELSRTDTEHLCGLLANNVAILCGVRSFIRWDILPRDIGCVWLAVCCEALGDADARAIELADDPLLLFDGNCLPACARRGIDHVSGPPERNRFPFQVQRIHQNWAILVDELLRQSFEIDADGLLLVRS